MSSTDDSKTPQAIRIRPATPDDAAGIHAIYEPFVLHDHATFEQSIEVATMRERIEAAKVRASDREGFSRCPEYGAIVKALLCDWFLTSASMACR